MIFEEEEEIWWPVTFERPDDSGKGRMRKETANFLWRLANMDLLQDRALDEDERGELLREELIEKLIDWDITTKGGGTLVCDESSKRALFQRPWFAKAIIAEWLECSLGGGAEKKSERIRRRNRKRTQ